MCEKTSQDCISVYMLWRFEIWENHFNSHTIITVWWGLLPLRYILKLPYLLKDTLAIIFKAICSFCFLFFIAYFLFKQTMNGHIRNKKEIPNNVKLLTLHFYYAEAYKCHWMIGGQQWWDGYLCLRIFKSFPSKRVIWVLSTRDNLILLITNTSHKAHLLSCA